MKRTALFESHKALNARFVLFAGWQMPFSYNSPSLEHIKTRKSGGLFDVSHMGQIRIQGRDSLSFLEKLLPSDLRSLQEGQALYSALCNKAGGLIDDLILYAFSKENYLLCVNAGSKDKDLRWIHSHLGKEKVHLQDESDNWALIAVQGPQSLELCSVLFPTIFFKQIPRFHFVEKSNILFSRTGYTGEDGFEIYIPVHQATHFWENFLKEGEAFSIGPVGLGARDTLRLEMKYLLSGQDFDESKSLLQAGLSRLMKSSANYIGKKALLTQKASGNYLELNAFVVEEAFVVPRKDFNVYSSDGEIIGFVTSGAKSPSLGQMIGLAYTKQDVASAYLKFRETQAKIRFVSGPFLKK